MNISIIVTNWKSTTHNWTAVCSNVLHSAISSFENTGGNSESRARKFSQQITSQSAEGWMIIERMAGSMRVWAEVTKQPSPHPTNRGFSATDENTDSSTLASPHADQRKALRLSSIETVSERKTNSMTGFIVILSTCVVAGICVLSFLYVRGDKTIPLRENPTQKVSPSGFYDLHPSQSVNEPSKAVPGSNIYHVPNVRLRNLLSRLRELEPDYIVEISQTDPSGAYMITIEPRSSGVPSEPAKVDRRSRPFP